MCILVVFFFILSKILLVHNAIRGHTKKNISGWGKLGHNLCGSLE